VLLNIQLIEAATDRPLWSEQYNREVVDIFALQNEVARKIAAAVSATVTPAEQEQIDKKPTDNLLAYDYYLQALDLLYSRTREGMEQAIQLFEKAIELDPQFSLAYANMTISYYFLDEYQKQKQYTEQINTYADKALLYDSRSAESLIAKALYYITIREFNLAVPHLEKALEYNPNSSAVVQILGDLYARAIPNTGKYLQYALKGVQLDVAGNDSITQSYTYLALSNALVQSGFVNEAMTYVNKSLDYDPGNYYAPLVKIYILHAQNGDITQTGRLLTAEYRKDTTRLDILQEVGKMHYFQEAYDSAFFYYEKFVNARSRQGLEIYPQEDLKIGITYEKMGLEQPAEELFSSYASYCERDQSIYKSASTAVKYVHEGKYDNAIEQLKIFATQDNYQYWILLFIEEDPVMIPLKSHPEYKAVIEKISERFWENQAVLKRSLEEKGLI
ncbi:tetratricopeptide repeat protein, partial [Robiginitalea sp.]|uniref:tetratricopeptide repeat protein n=1 Tax=Robiginitalea sp. TaxID=1902411 RepID=UPI003C720EB8